MRRQSAKFMWVLVWTLLLGMRPCAGNELFDNLVQHGVQLGPAEVDKLPMPVLDERMPAEQKQRAIAALIDGRYDWEAFSRNSVVSPFVLKIGENNREAGKIGRQIDLYFVAYGPLAKLASDDYLQKQLGLAASNSDTASGGKVKLLGDEELGKRKLTTGPLPKNERWVAVESTFLGKVRINLTTRNMKSVADDSVVVATIVDPRFDSDSEYPNVWRSISTDEAGRRQMGPPEQYSGLGSYMKATKLGGSVDMLFVEYHVTFAEPEGWFHGTNLLRSKLPIVAQDMVRKFRRNLSESN